MLLRKFDWVIALLLSCTAAAQDVDLATVTGTVADAATSQLLISFPVALRGLNVSTQTNEKGAFRFEGVKYGIYQIVLGSADIGWDTVKIQVRTRYVDLGTLYIHQKAPATAILPLPQTPDDEQQPDDDRATAYVASMLTASDGPFQRAAAFSWSPFWFKTRGYGQQEQQILINGLPMHDVERGQAGWSGWGGLNDVFRARATARGLEASGYSFGGLNGAVYLDAIAARQQPQTRITYSLSNRQYRNRMMLTRSTGMNRAGWACSFSLSRRWGRESYVDGTFYDSYSTYAAVSKTLGMRHSMHLTVFGVQTQRGRRGASYQEAYEILGDPYYNPTWGYQNGNKRSARVTDVFQPVAILSHEYHPSPKTRWITSIGYQAGKQKNSILDWYNAPDPRPDYYRYLPNYYLQSDRPDSLAAAANLESFKNYPQIQWDDLYAANRSNRMSLPLPDGSHGPDSGLRSVYVLGHDVEDIRKLMLGSNIEHVIWGRLTLAGGITFILQRSEHYRELADLLGGDFFVNINAFAERLVAGSVIMNQNDLNQPFGIVRKGDRYQYHFRLYHQEALTWGQLSLQLNKIDLFTSGRYNITHFQREGLYRNGIFPEGSFGYGPGLSFRTFAVKAGANWKITGRNYVLIYGGLGEDAPLFGQVYFAARTRNSIVSSPEARKYSTLEAAYIYRNPVVQIRLGGYATLLRDMTDQQLFYYQGTGSANTMVQYVLQNLDARFTGTELEAAYKLSGAVTVSAAAAIGQSFYTRNPKVTIYQENTPDTLPRTDDVYIRNYYLGVGPQSCYNVSLSYRSARFWYASLSFNWLDRNYVDIAASRRTVQTTGLLEPGSQPWNSIVSQERFPKAYTLDLFLGSSVLLSRYLKQLPRNTYLYLSIGLNNILDNKGIVAGGFENPRFDYAGGFAQRFGSRYYYAIGRNYFLNLSLKL